MPSRPHIRPLALPAAVLHNLRPRRLAGLPAAVLHNLHPRRIAALPAALCAAAALAGPAPAAPVETVIQDDSQFLYAPDAEVRAAFAKTKELGFERVRLNASWSLIAPSPTSEQRPSFDATDPSAYPRVGWSWLDRAVRLAGEAGLDTIVDIAFYAPRWATREGPDTAARPRTEIDAAEFGRFATAVARRYSGSYVPPSDPQPAPPPSPDPSALDQLLGRRAEPPPPPPPPPPGKPLPRVSLYTVWNEPNLRDFLLPQWEQRDGQWWPRAADAYREMVYTAYPAIKRVAPNARVLVGATSSTAAVKPGAGSVPPLRFIRALACVDEALRPISTGGCASFRSVPGDGWSHHPYSSKTLPRVDSNHPDNAPVAGTSRLADLLEALVRRGRLAPGQADLYMTEYGYETSPPDPRALFGPERQGALLAEAEYFATRDARVKMWAQFMLRDLPGDGAGSDWQSGLYFADGRPKPAAAEFRFPTFAECVHRGARRWVRVWGRVRGGAEARKASVESATSRALEWRAEATWPDVPAGGQPPAAAATAVPAAGAEMVAFARWQRGGRYRLRWEGSSEYRSAPVAPAGCKQRGPERFGRTTGLRLREKPRRGTGPARRGRAK